MRMRRRRSSRFKLPRHISNWIITKSAKPIFLHSETNGDVSATYLRQPFYYTTHKQALTGHKNITIKRLDRVQVEIALHACRTGRVVIILPGMGGSINGYHNKYKKLAFYLQKQQFSAVIRTDNEHIRGHNCDVNLRSALQYIRDHPREVSGVAHPEVFLMGYSAGAAACAAVAYQYPEVSRILLIAPSGDMPQSELDEGLAKFSGQLYVVQGREDEMVGVQAGQYVFDRALSASHKEIAFIDNCDHLFRGTQNSLIFSQAPLYAFAKNISSRPPFPDPEAGIELY